MTSARLPGGGKAWFVRKKAGWQCGLTPASTEGRLLSGAYVAVVTLLAAFFFTIDAGVVMVAAGIVLILAATFFFILTAIRMSAPASDAEKRRR